MRKFKKMVSPIIFILIITAFMALVFYENYKGERLEMSYRDFLIAVENGEVLQVMLTDSAKINFTIYEGQECVTDNPRNPQLKELLLKSGVSVTEGSGVSAYSAVQAVGGILFIGAGFFFANRLLSKSGGRPFTAAAMSMNVADASSNSAVSLRFEDVAGNEEAKESVLDLVDFIKNPKKFSDYGARMPRGIIFYGPPGTGKTLMAKAVAGEAGVPFYPVSGSDFVQMFVGVGASRVRELFAKARSTGKAVIFIDEIDALGKKRAPSVAGGNDEREQTLNALLTEMSGFSTGDGIVVIAATNRIDTLDEALLRPGRFDRQVEIGLPDINARETILRHHGANKPFSSEVDFHRLARETVYFSGAMLENLLNEAAIAAAKSGGGEISVEHLDSAYYTILAGKEKKDRSGIREREKKVTAYHEAGHALAAQLVSPENYVSRLTIIPSTKGAGGFCVNIPPDKMYYSKKELEAQIKINFAGRAAEEMIFGAENVTTGASNDIEKATRIAKDYISKFGMGEGVGTISTEQFGDSADIYGQCLKLTERLYGETRSLLTENMALLRTVAEELYQKETLSGDRLRELLNGRGNLTNAVEMNEFAV